MTMMKHVQYWYPVDPERYISRKGYTYWIPQIGGETLNGTMVTVRGPMLLRHPKIAREVTHEVVARLGYDPGLDPLETLDTVTLEAKERCMRYWEEGLKKGKEWILSFWNDKERSREMVKEWGEPCEAQYYPNDTHLYIEFNATRTLISMSLDDRELCRLGHMMEAEQVEYIRDRARKHFGASTW